VAHVHGLTIVEPATYATDPDTATTFRGARRREISEQEGVRLIADVDDLET
jgi:hypothetical protein